MEKSALSGSMAYIVGTLYSSLILSHWAILSTHDVFIDEQEKYLSVLFET